MGKDPSELRAEIEQTRERVGDEVDALSYKTDVGARVGDYVDDKKQAVMSTVTGVTDKVTGVVPDRRQLSTVKDTAERNPLGLAVGGVAVGFVAGLLLPSTKVENERMGELSDRVVDAAKDTAGEAVERGREVASAAADAAKETGRAQGQELASSLQDRAQEASSETTSASSSGESSQAAEPRGSSPAA
jgi:gas vesicle protein